MLVHRLELADGTGPFRKQEIDGVAIYNEARLIGPNPLHLPEPHTDPAFVNIRMSFRGFAPFHFAVPDPALFRTHWYPCLVGRKALADAGFAVAKYSATICKVGRYECIFNREGAKFLSRDPEWWRP